MGFHRKRNIEIESRQESRRVKSGSCVPNKRVLSYVTSRTQ